jgi:hypothetical protein
MKYKLKEGVGTHRRPSHPDKLNEPGKLVEPGEVFEPTPQELKAFGWKFVPVGEKDVPLPPPLKIKDAPEKEPAGKS